MRERGHLNYTSERTSRRERLHNVHRRTSTAAAIFALRVLATTTLAQPPVSSPSSDGSNEVRSKYTWGNIYLTYGVISDLKSLTQNQPKQDKLPDDEKTAIRLLGSVLNRYYKLPINQTIAVLVLDLNNGKAGFKRADDLNGAIGEIPWTQSDVHKVAVLCDKYLSGIEIVQNAQFQMTKGALSLPDAWNAFQQVSNNPYISDLKVASLKVDLKQTIEAHAVELKELQRNDARLFASIHNFAQGFDQKTATSVARVQSVDLATGTIIAEEKGKPGG